MPILMKHDGIDGVTDDRFAMDSFAAPVDPSDPSDGLRPTESMGPVDPSDGVFYKEQDFPAETTGGEVAVEAITLCHEGFEIQFQNGITLCREGFELI